MRYNITRPIMVIFCTIVCGCKAYTLTAPRIVNAQNSSKTSQNDASTSTTNINSAVAPVSSSSNTTADLNPVAVGPTQTTRATQANEPCMASPTFKVTALGVSTISSMGVPYDYSQNMVWGPHNWFWMYGQSPQIDTTAYGSDNEIDIFWQDQSTANQGFIVHLAPTASGYSITQAYQVQLLGAMMGMTRDEAGNYYYASGGDPDLTATYPAAGQYRRNIVRLEKFSPAGCVLFETDVDLAREAFDPNAMPLVNPMAAYTTSRIAYGANRLGIVFGINTAPDPTENNIRHQLASTTHFDATSGAVTLDNGMWVSHSLDQRMWYDGTGFVEVHLGDSYPRAIVLGRFTDTQQVQSYNLFQPKGLAGDNRTFTRLGGIVPIINGAYGYGFVFATDRDTTIPNDPDITMLTGNLEIAFTAVRRDYATDNASDPTTYLASGTATQTVSCEGNNVINTLTWLTNYAAEGSTVAANADRPRVAPIGGDQFIVMWERWEGSSADTEQFIGVFAMVIDGSGNTIRPATLIGQNHLPAAQDAISLGNQAAYVTGNQANHSLSLNIIDANLHYKVVNIP